MEVNAVIPAKEELPPIPKDLIRYLRWTFKVHVARDYDLRAYDRMVGQQQVLDHLESLYNQQQG